MNDREIDRLVAEKVMGLKVVDTGVIMYVEEGVSKRSVLHYSRRIEKAWLVVKKLHKECWAISISWHASPFSKPVVDLAYMPAMRDDKYTTHYRASAETVPMSICLAALAAHRVKTND